MKKANNNVQLITAFVLGMTMSFYGLLYPLLTPISRILNINLRINTLPNFLLYSAVYLLVHYVLQMLVRGSVKICIGRIIDNTLLHTTIVLAFFYKVYEDGNSETKSQAISYLEVFFYARILFSVSYLLGTIIKHQTLRSPFMGIGLGASMGMMTLGFGYTLKQLIAMLL